MGPANPPGAGDGPGLETAPAPRRLDRRLLAVVALFLFALSLQGSRGLYEPDEGRYSAVAVRMLHTGDWFTPRLNEDQLHFSKPPLFYWTLAASAGLFGVNEWALRLPSALAYVFTVLATFGIARRLVPERPQMAALVQATSLFPVVAANLVTTDPVLLLWETLAVLAFVAAWWDDPSPRWASPLLWLALALAFLTKGPPGLLPLAAIVAFSLVTAPRKGLRILLSPTGLALFFLVASPWFLLQARVRPDLVSYFWNVELLGRVSGVQNRNPGWEGIFEVYLPVALAASLPWSVVAIRRRGEPGPASPAGARRFLLLWVLVPLAVFVVAQSRLPLYLLPLTVPASLLLARRLVGWRPTRRGAVLLASWVLLLLVLKGFVAYRSDERDGRRFAEQLLARLGTAPPEIVFVDHYPRWSLAVYLDSQLEAVELLDDLRGRGGPAYSPIAESLADELAEPVEVPPTFLVPEESTSALRLALEERGIPFEERGRVGDLEILKGLTGAP